MTCTVAMSFSFGGLLFKYLNELFQKTLKVIVCMRPKNRKQKYRIYIILWIICLDLFSAKNSGPFAILSETIQRSAVELLFHLPSLDDSLLQNIVCCCHDGGVGVSVIQYFLQILHYRFIVHSLELVCFFSISAILFLSCLVIIWFLVSYLLLTGTQNP